MKTPLLFGLLLILSFGGINAQCALDGYTYLGSYNGHAYYVSSANVQWPAANTMAAATGGYLVEINDAGENNFVATALGGGNTLAWIGLSDAASEGTFVWTNGDPATYTSWGFGEPNDLVYCGYHEDYVEINRNGFGLWNDLPLATCNEDITRVFVVEFDADSDCDGVLDLCDHCNGGDDSGPCYANSFPGFEDIPADWVCDNNEHKVYVCHNGETICIDYHAVQAHLDHGDFLGPCSSCVEPRSSQGASSLQMDLYPNPVNQQLNIILNGTHGEATVYMFDTFGQMIYQQEINHQTSNLSLDVSQMATGTHFVQVIAGKENLIQKVMIVK
jgi:hypothetical protein